MNQNNRNVGKKGVPLPYARLVRWLDLGMRITLLVQLTMTALMFTGRFSNPDFHKELIGALLGGTAFGLWGMRTLLTRDTASLRVPHLLPLICFGAWCLLRAIFSPTPESLYTITIFLGMLAAFPVWLQQLRVPAFRNLLSWGVVALGVCMGAAALVESFGYYPLTLISYLPRQSVGSWLGHNNAMAGFLLVAIVYGVGELWRNRSNSLGLVFAGLVVIELYLIVISGSRGAWLASLAVAGALALAAYLVVGGRLKSLIPARLVPGLVVVLIVVCGVLAIRTLAVSGQKIGQDTGVLHRFTSLKETFAGTYPRVWWMSLQMMKDKPIMGVGFNAWQFRYPQEQGEWFTEHTETRLGLPIKDTHTQRAHNDFLQMAAELGIVGLGLFAWLLAVHLKQAWLLIRNQKRWDTLRMVGLVATTGTLAHSLIYFPFHAAAGSALFLANLALFAVAAPALPEQPRRPGRSQLPMGVGLFAALLTLTLLFWFVAYSEWAVDGKGTAGLMAMMLCGCGAFCLLAVTAPTRAAPKRRFTVRTQARPGILVAALLVGGGVVAVSGTWYGKLASADQRIGRARTYDYFSGNTAWLQERGTTGAETLAKGIRELNRSLELVPYSAAAGRLWADMMYKYAYQIQEPVEFLGAIAAYEHSIKTFAFYRLDYTIGRCHAFLFRYYREREREDDARKHYAEAVSWYRKAIFVYPFHYDMIRELGVLMHEGGETVEAMALYQKAHLRYRDVEPSFTEHIQTHGKQAARDPRRHDIAHFLFSAATSLEPENRSFAESLIGYYMMTGRADYALAVGQRYLCEQPHDVDILGSVFAVTVQGGDDGAVLAGTRYVIQLMEEQTTLEGWEPVALVKEIVKSYLSAGRTDDARAVCDAALEVLPEGDRQSAVAEYRNTL